MARDIGNALLGPEGADLERWPLVGRSDEVTQLKAAISGRRGAVITGPAGAGKTALATVGVEFARAAGNGGGPRRRDRGRPALPLRRLRLAPPPRLRPGRARVTCRSAAALHARAARRRRAAAVARLRRRRASARRRLGHAGPPAFADRLGHRARLCAGLRTGRPCPASDPMVVLWKDYGSGADRAGLARRPGHGGPPRHRPGRPGRHRVAAPVRRALAGRSPLPPRAGRRCAARTARCATRAGSGACAARCGRRPAWSSWSPPGWARSDRRGAARLGAHGARRASGPAGARPAGRQPAAIAALEDRGLIGSRMDGRRLQVCLAHPVYGDVVRVGHQPPARACAGSQALAEASGGRRQDDTLLLASLRLVGGGGSSDLLLAGAQAARERRDYALAERMARAAIDAGEGFEARLLAAEAGVHARRPRAGRAGAHGPGARRGRHR